MLFLFCAVSTEKKKKEKKLLTGWFVATSVVKFANNDKAFPIPHVENFKTFTIKSFSFSFFMFYDNFTDFPRERKKF